MSRAQLMQRVARLETRRNELQIQGHVLVLSPEERLARIRLLTHRLMSVRGIAPNGDESLADAAVRAASTINGFSTRLVPTVRRIFRDEQS